MAFTVKPNKARRSYSIIGLGVVAGRRFYGGVKRIIRSFANNSFDRASMRVADDPARGIRGVFLYAVNADAQPPNKN